MPRVTGSPAVRSSRQPPASRSMRYNTSMSETARLNISLPDRMLSGISNLVEEGEFSTPSEFVRDAVRREMERRSEKSLREKTMAHIKQMADEAFESGEAVEIRDLEEWKASQLARLEKKLGSKNGDS